MYNISTLNFKVYIQMHLIFKKFENSSMIYTQRNVQVLSVQFNEFFSILYTNENILYLKKIENIFISPLNILLYLFQ